MKILSIVIPTYNMASLLPRCLDSMTSPKLIDELEVLVVNDGSKDNSLEVAKSYEERFPGIVYAIDKPNGNYGSTVNKGIEIATGKYFRICDSDDFYDNEQLSRLVEKLKDTDTDLVLTDYVIDRDNHPAFMRVSGIEEEKVMDMQNVEIANVSNYAMHGLTIRTSLLKENGISLLIGISYTDIEYCYYPLKYAKDVIRYSLPVYHYQVGRDGQTVSLESQIRCLSHMRKIIDRMLTDLTSGISETTDKNRSFIASRIINLYYATALCYDRSNKELESIEKLDARLNDFPMVVKYLEDSNMFGVKFFERYHNKKKLSNDALHLLYYNIVKTCAKIYRRVSH